MSNPLADLDIEQSIEIRRPIADVFEGVLQELTEQMRYPDGTSMNMKMERRPGGRWFRDLGNDTGHLWGFVQTIRTPDLLELSGPLCMSYPCANYVGFRLSESDGVTRIAFRHQAIGPVSEEHRNGMSGGWRGMLEEIKTLCEA